MSKTIIHLAAVAAVTLVATSAAFAQDATDEGLTRTNVTRYVQAGKAQSVWNLGGVRADCSPWELPDAKTTTAPQHGTVEIVPADLVVDYPKESASAKCNGRKVRGLHINYKSAAGYTGDDEFEAFVLWEGGYAQELHFKINVR
jgi:hypothetical protein